MADLNSLKLIKNIDQQNYLGSIYDLPKQIDQAWSQVLNLTFPKSFQQIENIVVAGMGGSALGPEVVKNLYQKQINYPFEIIRDYHLPYYINNQTLVILSSYSGNTEETISTAEEAIDKKAKAIAISTGGKLIELFKQKKLPYYHFDPKYNYCNQPRAGIGYSIACILATFKNLKLINITDKQIKQTLSHLKDLSKQFTAEINSDKNAAKSLAIQLQGKIPIIIGSEFMAGNCHIFANQLNETAKTFAAYFTLPELNHHLLEGLSFPKDLKDHLCFIFFESSLYQSQIQKRLILTKEIISQKDIDYVEYHLTADSALSAAFEMLMFTSHVSFYLAILNERNPTPVPIVEEFKNRLKAI